MQECIVLFLQLRPGACYFCGTSYRKSLPLRKLINVFFLPVEWMNTFIYYIYSCVYVCTLCTFQNARIQLHRMHRMQRTTDDWPNKLRWKRKFFFPFITTKSSWIAIRCNRVQCCGAERATNTVGECGWKIQCTIFRLRLPLAVPQCFANCEMIHSTVGKLRINWME